MFLNLTESSWWREVQGGHGERRGEQRADEEKPQAGGEPEVLHLVSTLYIIYIILIIIITIIITRRSEKNPPAKTPKDPPKTDAQKVQVPMSKCG